MQSAASTLQAIRKKVLDATVEALQNASDDIQSTAQDATHNWRNQPEFRDTFYYQVRTIEVVIKPEGDKRKVKIFSYIDLGTKGPYLIPKFVIPGRYLKFRTGYSARTQPIARYNVGTGQSFGSWVSKLQVIHPGIKARKFLETFMRDIIPALEVRVQSAITKSLA